MLPLTADRSVLREYAAVCDGFLFTGGPDLAPAYYGQEPLPGLVEICPERDEAETVLLETVLPLDKPVFGICRGIQLLNVFLGGTLYQDLPAEHPTDICHRQTDHFEQPCHGVTVLAGSELGRLLGKEFIRVNSSHHQAVRKLSGELSAMAYSEDGLVEAVRMKGMRFVRAVQWHPEYTYNTDPVSGILFQSFVDACREE